MRTILKIKNGDDWHDYSSMVIMSGLGWKRNDLDAEGSGRTLDGDMWRVKVAQKRTLDFKLLPDREERYADIDTDLSQEEFDVQYRDLHGVLTKTFYCTAFSATLDEEVTGPEWSGGTFTLVEV